MRTVSEAAGSHTEIWLLTMFGLGAHLVNIGLGSESGEPL